MQAFYLYEEIVEDFDDLVELEPNILTIGFANGTTVEVEVSWEELEDSLVLLPETSPFVFIPGVGAFNTDEILYIA